MTKPVQDVSDTILANSDQLNADDLMSGPIVVQVKDVRRLSKDQPIEITISGGHRPWRPSKTSRRVLVYCWGKDARQWVGRWVELYRDPDVEWAGRPVGGIRVCALSHLDGPRELSLQVKRGKKVSRTIGALTPPERPDIDAIAEDLGLTVAAIDAWLTSMDRPTVADMDLEDVRRLAGYLQREPDAARQAIGAFMDGGQG